MSDTNDADDGGSTVRDKIDFRKTVRVLGMIVLIAVVLPFLIYSVPQAVGADHSYVVLSGSMEPTMSPGDVIIVDSTNPSQIKKGDIITYGAAGERPTTHRVIEVTEEDGTPAYRTKGDANEDADRQLVTPDQIRGEVMTVGGYPAVIPYMGYIIQFAGTQYGFVALFVVPLVLLVLSEIWNVAAGRDGEAETDTATEADAEAETVHETDIDADGPDDEPAAQVRDGTDTAADVETAAAPETDDGGITFTAPELQLGLVAFGAFLVYSVWVTYATREIWSFGVAGSVAAAFLLLTILYISGGDANENQRDTARASATDGGTTPPDQRGTEQTSDTTATEEEKRTSGEDPARDGDDESGLSSQSMSDQQAGEQPFNFVSDAEPTGERADDDKSKVDAGDSTDSATQRGESDD